MVGLALGLRNLGVQMIDFKAGTIRLLSPNAEKIHKWSVWFRTFEGLFVTMDGAVKSCETTGQDPSSIRPVPVAIDEHGNYEECA